MPRLSDIDLDRRAIERGGWLSPLPKDPGAYRGGPWAVPAPSRDLVAVPARRSDFDPSVRR